MAWTKTDKLDFVEEADVVLRPEHSSLKLSRRSTFSSFIFHTIQQSVHQFILTMTDMPSGFCILYCLKHTVL